MNRLQLQWQRLYLPQPGANQDGDADMPCLVDAGGGVRAMVLALSGPADWAACSLLWRGVQSDLDLPAPAIAVAGPDGYQLWFSLAAPVPAAQAGRFLDALRLRYLADVPVHRVGLFPRPPGASAPAPRLVRRVPAALAGGGRWSAFVAPDLAPMFAEEPWLDTPPNPEGQAALLSQIHSIAVADWQRALQQLAPQAPATAPPQAAAVAAIAAIAADAGDVGAPDTRPPPADGWTDPRRFLLHVMNDETVALPLRIEAAKALLPGLADPGGA